MRLVKLYVREDHREAVLSVLDDEGIDYLVFGDVRTDAGGDGGEVLVEFPLPDQAVEYLRNEFDEAGLEDEYVVTLTAESART